MSGEYMRQIMEAIDLAQAQTLSEGYEDRVNKVVSIINSQYSDGITKKEFPAAVERAGEQAQVGEMKPTVAGRGHTVGDSRKEFIKDVAAKITFKRDTSAASAKKARREEVLIKLEEIITDAVGMSFPDGDPFDHIYPRARKLGIPADAVLEWLDLACRKHGLGKSFHGYLQGLWDDQYGVAKADYDSNPNNSYAADRYNSLGGDNYQNPWG